MAVGKLIFRRRATYLKESKQQICTVSDEAVALLILENNYNKWIDVHNNTKDQTVDKNNRKGEAWNSKVPTLYTQQGQSYDQKNFRAGDRGWSVTGIERFNVLFDLVLADRKTNKKFLKTWLPYIIQGCGGGKAVRSRANVKQIVVARNELGMSEENEDEEYDPGEIAENSDDHGEEDGVEEV